MIDPTRTRLRTLLAVLSFAIPASAGEEAGYHLRNWTTRDGLPQNSVLDIAVGADGGLWLSTEAGVALSYGGEFEVFELQDVPGLDNNRIRTVVVARDGTVWLGVTGGQVLYSTDSGWGLIHSPWEGTSTMIWDMVEDLEGRLWLASSSGAAVLDRGAIHLVPELNWSVRDLEVMSNGDVVAASGKGLHRLRIDGDGDWKNERLVQRGVDAVAMLSNGQLVLSLGGKLVHLDGTVFSEQVELVDRMLAPDANGGLWASTEHGLMHFDGGAWTRPQTQEPDALGPSTAIISMRVHPDGYLWVGTSRKGLFQLYPTPLQGYAIQGEPAESVYMVGVDHEQNTWGFGTSTMLLADGELRVVDDRGYDAVAASRAGTFFWTHGKDGLGTFSGGQFESHPLGDKLPQHLCRALLEDSKGRLWVGFNNLLLRIEGGEVTEVPAPADHSFGQIRVLVEDSAGTVWVGGDGALAGYEDGAVGPRVEEIPMRPVRALLATARGDLWIGSYGGGLSLLRDGQVTNFRTTGGLHENVVTAIYEDGHGALVLQGNQGVSLVSLNELELHIANPDQKLAVQIFESCPGLATVEGNSVSSSPAPISSDGAIWFPTLEGLVSYNGSHLLRPKNDPEILLSYSIEGAAPILVPTEGRHAISLPVNKRTIEMQYRSPSYSPFSDVRFRLRLVGLNPSWIEREGGGAAWFHRTAHGTYPFEIQAANVDHNWGPAFTGIDITVHPYFYERLWFRVLSGLAAVVALYGVIRWRTQRIQRHNKKLAGIISERTRDLRLQIREREGAEARLQAAHDALELAVTERTRELASTLKALEADVAHRESLEVRLKESEKLEIVGRLAGGIAHDFNNILTAVLGEAELVGMEAKAAQDTNLHTSMENIASNVERAGRLTRQLLAYSRQQVLQPVVLDPRKHLSGIEEMLQRLTPAAVKLSIDLSGTGHNVRMDPGQLEQVLVNLVVNAGESMQQAGEVRVWLEETTKTPAEAEALSIVPGRYVVLNVMDEGDGIQPETASRMFEPFFSTKNMSRGLGLASVHGIVHQSGGTIEMRTEIGEGTTFRVLLPAVNDPVRQYVLPAPPSKPPGAESARILICDDEQQVLNVLQLSLQRRGYQVTAVGSPLAALEFARTADPKPDLLISDMAMPEMDGFTLAKQVHELLGNIPTIFITGYSLEVLAEGDALPNGALLLQKPFTADDLVARVSEALMVESN